MENEMAVRQWLDHMQTQVEKGVEGHMAEQFCWTLDNLLESVEGDWIGPLSAESKVCFNQVCTDSRQITPGALYVAIVGDRFDGHDFVEQAVQQGASAVLLSKQMQMSVPGVLVNDTRIALGQFARWHRQQMPVKKVIAVTGSNGKTTTKTMLRSIFEQAGTTLATEGNLNNDYGVPRTVLNIRPEHEYAIIEMGANHLKEIGYLTNIALPDIALITNAAGAHLEGFGSLQGVIETKAEIYQGLNQCHDNKDGVAVVNTDSAGYDYWIPFIESLGVEKIVRFGTQPEADIKVQSVQTTDKGIQFDLDAESSIHPVQMAVLGQHNAMNAAACVAIARSAGLSWQQVTAGLAAFTGVDGRLRTQKTRHGILIDDSYNANPESVKAGISTLVSLAGVSVLCLGEMAELGAESVQLHADVARFAKEQGVQHLLIYGAGAKGMESAFGEGAHWFDSHESLAETAQKILADLPTGQSGNVLVKGSRSAQMEKVANALLI